MKTIYSFLIVALEMISCATSQVIPILSPEAPEGHFEMGREYIYLRNDSIQIELGFDGIFKENLVFDVVVINSTGHPLSFNPSDFYRGCRIQHRGNGRPDHCAE